MSIAKSSCQVNKKMMQQNELERLQNYLCQIKLLRIVTTVNSEEDQQYVRKMQETQLAIYTMQKLLNSSK